jgi:hypothetical protein
MPRKPDPRRKKPPRVAIRKELVPVVESYCDEQGKDLSEVVNDALRQFFSGMSPPRWPPPKSQPKDGEP